MNRRVLVIGPLDSGALALSYARAFERLGMEVVPFDSECALHAASRFTGIRILRRAMRRRLWNAVNREALRIARETKPALIFAVKCSFFDGETVSDIRRLTGAPFVNHYPDNPYIGITWDPREASALRRDLIEVFRQYSMVFMWGRTLLERLQRDGVEARYLTFAVDPELFQPQAVGEGLDCERCHTSHDVAFVATYSRSRCDEVAAIRRHTIAVWGNNWPHDWRGPAGQHRAHPPVWGSDVSRIYARAPVSINVLNRENLGGPNMRTFEIPGSGGCMLARWSPAQHGIFPEGEAAAYYRSPGEIDDKLDELLRDRDLRARLRRNATRIAAGETYDVRAETVLRECGLPVPNPVAQRSVTH